MSYTGKLKFTTNEEDIFSYLTTMETQSSQQTEGKLLISPNETFLSLCLAGQALHQDIDDFVDAWHDSEDPRTLQEYLGFNNHEYSCWVKDAQCLKDIIFSHYKGEGHSELERPEIEYSLAARCNNKEKYQEFLTWYNEHIQKS